MIQTIKQNKKAVLAFLLALVMLIGIIPFTATEAHAITIDASGTVTWENGDSFTLHLVNKEDFSKTETHTVTYDGTSWNNPKSDILPAYAFAHTGEVNDIAFSDGNWSYTPVLQEDQSDAEKLAATDVMIATGEASADSPLNLNFKHVYAKVTFNIEYASEFTDSQTATELLVKSLGVDSLNVKACISNDGKTATAIVSPDAYNIDDEFIRIYVDGATEPLIVKMPEDRIFEEGTHYTFNLKVGKDTGSVTN